MDKWWHLLRNERNSELVRLVAFIFFIFVMGCSHKQPTQGEPTKIVPPEVFMLTTDTLLHNNNGTWYHQNQKADGYILEKKGNALIAKLPVIDGKEHGVAYGWFETGEKRYEKCFKNGNRDGHHKTWYKNGQLAGVNFYIDDKLDGEQKTYYETGNICQILNYANGYEEGKQKTWNDSGRVINNFTVKNGKLYGIIGRYDCMSVMEN